MAGGSLLTLRFPLRRAIGLAALIAAGAAAHVVAQDPVPRDTLIEVLPDSLRDVFADTVPRRAQAFPERRGEPLGRAAEVFTCDRTCIQSSPAFSLLELLLEEVPGIAGINGGFFAGPHHALDGPYGAGFVTVRIDGRELPSLERAQPDLRRISLSNIERVRAWRGAAGTVIDVDTYRHDSGRAYSRISGGTGQPSLQILDGLFANGLGRTFVANGSFDLLDAEAGGIENDRFEALARVSWMPKSNDFGVQLEYRTENADRRAADTAEVRRREFLVRTRGNLGDRTQFDAYWASSSHWLELAGLGEDEEEPSRGVKTLGVRVTTRPWKGRASVGVRLSGGEAYASTTVSGRLGYPVGPVWLDGGYEVATWPEFTASSWRGGLSWNGRLLVPVELRAFAAAGDRGVGNPQLETAESVGFTALGAAGGLELGPIDVSGRVGRQRLDRALGLAASWDSVAVLDSAEVEVTSWEARVEGPFIPIGAIIPGLEPIRLRAWWRQNSGGTQGLPIYVPEHVGRFELTLNDRFFDGNLEIWLGAFVERRGQRLLPVAGETDPALVSGYTWPGGYVMFKIGDFRAYYRVTNPTGLLVSDIPNADLPVNIGLFGIRWEFFN